MTRRRVIFVPDNYWTNPPKENTMSNTTPGDYRRATVLTIHHRDGMAEGFDAVLDEAIDAGRPGELLGAVLKFNDHTVGLLRSPDGRNLLNTYFQGWADVDPADAPNLLWPRAARIILAFGASDWDAIETELQAVADNTMMATLGAILDLYEYGVPEISSPAGLDWLHRCAAAFLSHEGREGNA